MVTDTAETVKAKLCSDFKPERLSEPEAADSLTLNYAARAREHWGKICKEGT